MTQEGAKSPTKNENLFVQATTADRQDTQQSPVRVRVGYGALE